MKLSRARHHHDFPDDARLVESKFRRSVFLVFWFGRISRSATSEEHSGQAIGGAHHTILYSWTWIFTIFDRPKHPKCVLAKEERKTERRKGVAQA